MNVYIEDKKEDLGKLIKEQLSKVYPGLYSSTNEKGEKIEGRPVDVMVVGTGAQIDQETKVAKFNINKVVRPFNEVPFDLKKGVLERGTKLVVRIADDQYRRRDNKGYKYVIQGPLGNFITIQGRMELTEADDVLLWYLTFISGGVKGNLCPEEFRDTDQPIYIYSPHTEAKKFINSDTVSIAKAKLYLIDSVDGISEESELRELARILNISYPDTKDLIELRKDCIDAVEGDLTGSYAKIVLSHKESGSETTALTAAAKKLIADSTVVYDEPTKTWRLQKGDALGPSLMQVDTTVSKAKKYPVDAFVARYVADAAFRETIATMIG